MGREVDVPERDDRRGEVRALEGVDDPVELVIREAREQAPQVEGSPELLAELGAPASVVFGEGGLREVTVREGLLGNVRGDLRAPHAREDAPAREGLHLRGRVADEEGASSMGPRKRPDRDPRDEVGGRIREPSTEPPFEML